MLTNDKIINIFKKYLHSINIKINILIFSHKHETPYNL